MGRNTPILTLIMHSLNLFNLLKSNTCFNTSNTSIDSILTNRKNCFKQFTLFETRLRNNHFLIYSLLKITFKKEGLTNTVITESSVIQNDLNHQNKLDKGFKTYQNRLM